MEKKIHSLVQIDPQFEAYIEEKCEKLQKFLFGDARMDLYIKKEGPEYVTQMAIRGKGINLFVKEGRPDLNASIEGLFDKAKAGIAKTHNRIIEQSHQSPIKETPAELRRKDAQ